MMNAATIRIDPADYRLQARFWSKVAHRKGDGCWPWQGVRMDKGYGRFAIDGAMMLASRVAWSLANGGQDAGDGFICHTCDNPPCVNPAHLYLGDAHTNAADRVRREAGGRQGEGNPRSVLTAEQVREIRRTHKEAGPTLKQTADHYGVGISAIQRIVSGKSWSHIQ